MKIILKMSYDLTKTYALVKLLKCTFISGVCNSRIFPIAFNVKETTIEEYFTY